MTNLTRGGLSPAQIINLITNDKVDFMFNPYEFTISKSVQWDVDATGGVDEPPSKFKRGDARTISLTLHFDTQPSGDDVTGMTAKLWKMAMIDSSTINRDSNKGNPPPVAFKWGKFYFTSIITKISEKFTLFDEDGTPLRCEVSLDLQQHTEGDSGASSPSATTSSSSSASSGGAPPSTATFTQGDRVDLMAAENGMGHRELMEKNNIDNPNQIRNGQQLRTS
jgi:hypothetical protein